MTIQEIVKDVFAGNIITKEDGVYIHESMFQDVAELIEEKVVDQISEYYSPVTGAETSDELTEKFLIQRILTGLKEEK